MGMIAMFLESRDSNMRVLGQNDVFRIVNCIWDKNDVFPNSKLRFLKNVVLRKSHKNDIF